MLKKSAVYASAMLLAVSGSFSMATAALAQSYEVTPGVVVAPSAPDPVNPGSNVTISPGMVGTPPNPSAANPSQQPAPQSPGVIVTIPTE